MRPIYIFTEKVTISINTAEPVTEIKAAELEGGINAAEPVTEIKAAEPDGGIKASEPDGVIGAEADIENAISALADVPLCMVHKVMDVLREVCDEIDG